MRGASRKAGRLPRAAVQISRTGMMTPTAVRIPLKLMTRVFGPIAEIITSASSAELFGGSGIFTSRTVMPSRLARLYHGDRPLGCSSLVIRTSSPGFRSMPSAIMFSASVAL